MKTKTLATIATIATFAIGAHLGARTASAVTSRTTYQISIKTGCYAKAGTDAKVTIQVEGSTGAYFRKVLDNPSINDFERGFTDGFLFTEADLGDPTKVVIWHDNTGSGPGWLVDSIRILNYRTGNTSTFPVQRWIATDECDGSTALYLNRGIRPYCTIYYYGTGSGC